MEKIQEIIKKIKPLDEGIMAETQRRLDNLTKPVGSLAVLEDMARQLAGARRKARPGIPQKAIVLMAADHGVADEGVSAYPAEVTEQMVYNFVRGGAAISVLARHADASLVLVDVGVRSELPQELPIRHCKIRMGTSNMRYEPAMNREDVIRALKTGIRIAEELADQGIEVIALGEMGIGNTTASSAIASLFTGKPVSQVVGKGTGLSGDFVINKIKVIEEAIVLNKPNANDAIDVLAKVGGLEIAGLAGVVLGAASRRVLVLVDGFITSAAALAAYRISRAIRPYLMASHLSEEPGHAAILECLGLKPYLRMNLRLGEGSGAALGLVLLDAAVKILNEMATFSEAQVEQSVSALPEMVISDIQNE